jgi:group I intron endonuclease
MIGIYKITSPSGKIYIGQSTSIERRKKSYAKARCTGQVKLYRSIVKYGFSEHTFEVVEECKIEDLSARERYWQEFYNVLGERGLNCSLTGTESALKVYTKEHIDRHSRTLKIFYNTPEGIEVRAKGAAKTDYIAIVAKKDHKSIAKSLWKSVLQYEKDGTLLQEWQSVKEAGETLGIDRSCISLCLKGKYNSAGGFIWKYK